MQKPFSDGDLLRMGWKQAINNLGFFILLFLVMLGVALVPMIIFALSIKDYPVVAWSAYAIYILVALLMGVGTIKISLSIIDGEKPKISDLFLHADKFLTFLGISILYAIIVFVGFLLFIIPGVIWMTKFFLAPYYAVDKGLNPIEALKASSAATMGMKWDILAFYIVAEIVITLGFFALGIGAFVSVPTGMIAMAGLYRLMDGGSIKAK